MSRKRLRPFGGLQATIAFTLFSLVFVAVVVVEVVSYRLTEQTVTKNSEAYTLQLVQEANRNIDSYVSYMKNISSVIMYDREVESYFAKSDPQNAARVVALLASVKRTRTDINLIALFGLDGKVVADRDNVQLNPYVKPADLLWYRAALRARGMPVISPSHVQFIVGNHFVWVTSLSREIFDFKTGRPLAVLLVDLNFSVIRNICANINLGNRGYVFIVDSGGTIIYHPQQELIYSNLKTELINRVVTTRGSSFIAGTGKSRRIYTISTSDQTGWKIVGVTYVDNLVSDKQFIQIYYLLLGMACLIVVGLLSVLISVRISRPIKTLTRSVQEVEKGNFEIKVRVTSSDEIGNLAAKFNLMIAKIRDLMLQNEREHRAKRRAELAALQAQINPHFLYNTLDSVVWMAEVKKHEQVVKMVSSLAKLLRLSISKGDEIVTIRQEIEHITNYLIIQKMRYRDKLDFRIEVDENIYANRILKLLLQPLVENSIYHGIKNKKEGGIVRVLGKRTGSRVLMQVVDNGIGIDPERMRRILDGDDGDGTASSRGVGIKNVHERIRLYFGDEYGLSFRCANGSGTTVDIWLPAVE